MNDFFDKLGAAARRAAGNVANEVNVAAEKQKLSDHYKALGKLCYQAAKRGEHADIAELVAKIDESLKRIEELKESRDVTVEPAPRAEEPEAKEPDFVIVDEE